MRWILTRKYGKPRTERHASSYCAYVWHRFKVRLYAYKISGRITELEDIGLSLEDNGKPDTKM